MKEDVRVFIFKTIEDEEVLTIAGDLESAKKLARLNNPIYKLDSDEIDEEFYDKCINYEVGIGYCKPIYQYDFNHE